MTDQPYLYVIIESNGHSAVAHKQGDWQGEHIQIHGSNSEGVKVRIGARTLCERFGAPVIDLRQFDTEEFAQEFPICTDVFVGYRGGKAMTIGAYLKWFINHNIKVWMPEQKSVQEKP